MLHLELERVELGHNTEFSHDSEKQKKIRASLYGAEEDDSGKSDSDSSDDEEVVVDPTPSQIFDAKKAGYRYQAPIYFGANKNKALMSFDTSTSYTTVTSDLCSNCETQAYKQQDSGKDSGLPMQLEFNQGGQKTSLQCLTYTDTVCLNEDENDSMCIGQF